jgi:hypothetical protein
MVRNIASTFGMEEASRLNMQALEEVVVEIGCSLRVNKHFTKH